MPLLVEFLSHFPFSSPAEAARCKGHATPGQPDRQFDVKFSRQFKCTIPIPTMPAVTYGSLLTYGPIMAKMDHVKPQSCSVAVPCAKDAWMQEWALKSLNVQSDSGSALPRCPIPVLGALVCFALRSRDPRSQCASAAEFEHYWSMPWLVALSNSTVFLLWLCRACVPGS